MALQFICTSSFAHFARSATSPSFAYVSNLAPDNSLCRAAAPRLRPLQLLLPDCVRFSFCSSLTIASTSAAAPRLRPLQLLLPNCICFNCCSQIASASAAARHLQLRPLQLLLPNCICFNCCSQIASASAAAPN